MQFNINTKNNIMKNKIFITAITILLLSSIVLAQNNSIRYGLQLKGSQYEDKGYNNYYKDVIPYTFLDSAKMEYLAKTYVKVLFAKKENEIEVSNNLQYSKYDKSIPEILKGSIDSLKDIFFIKGDTIFMKWWNDDLKQESKPYMSINGNFEFRTDTIIIETEYGEYIEKAIFSYKNLLEQFGGFQFHETWNYNSKKGIFNKKINNILTFFVFEKEMDDYDIEQINYHRMLTQCYFKPKQSYPTKLLAKNLIYDVKVIPNFNEEHTNIEYSNNFLETTNRNDIILGLLDNAKTGKIESYSLKYDDKLNVEVPNFNNQLNYKAVIDSLSFTINKNVIGIDTAKLRELKLFEIRTLVDTIVNYKLDEYGDYEYDENGYEIIESIETNIFGYDTIWLNEEKWLTYYTDTVFNKDKNGKVILDKNLNPQIKSFKTIADSIGALRTRIMVVKIITDTIIKYKVDEYGDYIYDDNDNMIITQSWLTRDTIFKTEYYTENKDNKKLYKDPKTVFKKRIANPKYEYYYTDTVFHNKLENVYRFRFYEDWYFDEKTFTIQKKVKGIVLIIGVKEYDLETKRYKLNLKPEVYFKLN